MIRITWLCTPISASGGTLTSLARWARYLDHDRFAVRFVYYAWRPELVGELFAGTPVELVPISNPLSALVRRGSLSELRSAIQPADVLTTVFIQADVLGALAVWTNDLPILSFAMGRLVQLRAPLWKRLVYGGAYRLARRRISRFAAVSGATGAELVEEFGVPADRVTVVRSGIATVPRPPARRLGGAPTVAFVGALIREKGPEDFLRASALIAGRMPSTRFIVLGDGPLLARCRELASELGIPDRVTFLGWRDASVTLATVDLLLFTSLPRYDGLPQVLLEALRVGTPVVATRVAGIPEVIRDGVEGLLVKPAEPRALADAAIAVLGDPERWARYSEAAVQRSRSFTPEQEVGQLMELWEALAAMRRGSGLAGP